MTSFCMPALRCWKAVSRCLLLAVVWLPFALHAQALTLTSGVGESQGAEVIDNHAVLEQAVSAFTASARRLVQSMPRLDENEERLDRVMQLVNEISEEFDKAAQKEVDELRGDGVLTVSEVSDSLGRLREEHFDRLKLGVEAIASGYAPPPSSVYYENGLAYIKALVTYVLTERNTPREWLYLAGSLATGMIIAWIGNTILRRLAEILKRHARFWLADMLESLTGPVYITAIISGFYAGSGWIWIPGVAHETLKNLMHIALLASLFWFFWNASNALASGIAWVISKSYSHQFSQHVVVVISRILRVAILITFTLLLINVILESDLTGLLAGLGVVGIALSFVLKGTIENIAASFTIFGDKPFRIGDLMQFKDEWGHVEDIGFRSTRYRTLDGHLINIPNSMLIRESLHNVGERPHIRRRFRISITYGTPPEKIREAIEIVRDILDHHKGQPPDLPPHVVFESYGPYDLRLLVQYYYTPPHYWEALEFDSEVNLKILERFNQAGIDFAFPTQTSYLANATEDGFRIRSDTIERSGSAVSAKE